MCILIIELFSFCVTVEWPKDLLPELPLTLSDAHSRCDQITLLLMTSGALCIITSYRGTHYIYIYIYIYKKLQHIKSIWNSHANLSFKTLITVMYLLKREREKKTLLYKLQLRELHLKICPATHKGETTLSQYCDIFLAKGKDCQ